MHLGNVKGVVLFMKGIFAAMFLFFGSIVLPCFLLMLYYGEKKGRLIDFRTALWALPYVVLVTTGGLYVSRFIYFSRNDFHDFFWTLGFIAFLQVALWRLGVFLYRRFKER